MTLVLKYKGFNYTSYYNGDFAGDDSLGSLPGTGSNAIATVVEYGFNPHDDEVYTSSTWTDDDEALAISEGVGEGLSVMVRPVIDLLPDIDYSGTGYSAGEWRSYINPGAAGSASANAFFASYQTMILQQAKLAATNGATWLSIGVELDQIAGPAYKSYWDSIIDAIRAQYPTLKLTYSADWNAAASPWAGDEGLTAGTGNFATQISFASELDAIGIDEYAPISNSSDPTLAQLIAGWTETPVDAGATAATYKVTGDQSLISYYESVAAAVGKPLLFTELGYGNSATAASDPANSNNGTPEDDALQAELYLAFFQAWRQDGNSSLEGLYLWNWDPNAGEVGPGSVGFSPQGLPALSFVDDYFLTGGRSDILFRDVSGALSNWLVDDAAITGGGAIGAPGVGWTFEATGDFYGNGLSDALWRDQNGDLQLWEISGSSLVASAEIGNPGGTWQVVGVGDFNGDGRADILFRDAAGDLATWDLDGSSIVGGGVIGNPGADWTFLATGDFNGDGKSDLLFENASGDYATWTLDDTTVTGAASLGYLPSGWVFKGVGDFNGDGTSDILFENMTTGLYATWDIKNDAVSGGGNLGVPGGDWTFAGIGAYGASSRSDILFRDGATGQYASWDLDDTTISGGGLIGALGAGFSVEGGPPAAAPELPAMIFFQNTYGDVAAWDVSGAVDAAALSLGVASGETMLGVGDFWGDHEPGILFENQTTGHYSLWRTNGSQIVVGGGDIGAPGGSWSFKAIGDFNGDGTSDILFEDAYGNYATWDLNGISIIGGGTIGNPGAGWTFKAAADFSGDGTSDLLFENASGDYALWDIGDNQYLGAGNIGAPGGTWSFVGAGDFDGDGKSDLLFEDASGNYATWDLSGNAIVGEAVIGNPGAGWVYQGVADLEGNHQDSILFMNTSSGEYATWEMNDAAIVSVATLGAPGAGWSFKAIV